MNIKKLNETLSKMFEDEQEIINVVQEYVSEIPEVLDSFELSEIQSALCENLDCIIYGENGTNNLVIDVKGRPYIEVEAISDYLATPDGEQAYQFAINSFAQELTNKWDDFVILGRSGGYWGFEDVSITLSQEGLQALARLTKAKADAEYEGSVVDAISENYQDFFTELAEDADNFTFTQELLNKINQLKDLIDEKEKQMNTKEFWGI